MELQKVYEPQRFEPHWAQWWIESGIYRVDAKTAQKGRVFSIVIPPPNVTGALHIGHMLDHTTMDVAVRWHRMLGETALWVPGTDHAGIATQMVVERQLATENVTRKQLGREKFECRVWQWKEEYGGRINNQIRREGASVDWSRERFTMDPGLSRAVREAFVRLWDKGLIYRGEYMVNWCPRDETAISDVETIHEAVQSHLWHVRYPVVGSDEFLEVATTRPETILGDTALAVHPEDARYKHLHGRKVTVPLVNREVPIIADPMADPKFGTGVVKITPAHDPNDFEAGKRHSLPFIKVIGEDARMTAAAGKYAGLDRFEARKRVVAALEEDSSLVKTEPYTVNISKCDRCKSVIEPLVSMQWFVRMKTLAEKATEAVRSGKIRFVPDDREVVFFQWMDNIRDWCISRQLWWGHRIPAWHCHSCGQITVARETPATCRHCHSTEVEQDKDVLDTWFSSGLWPFSTLGWPDETEDLKTFYPTSLLVTGFDILFFWVSRMIMLGIEMTGEVPFREVHMHGLVRDADRQKMSKTKGNVVDPLQLIDRFGTDALRIALLISAAAGADIALKEDRMTAGRGFANKLWNASRFLFMNMERSGIRVWSPSTNGVRLEPKTAEDAWIADRFNVAAETVNRAVEVHRYHEAAQALWNFVWGEFCDWYVERKKLRFQEGSGLNDDWQFALTVYESSLRLLHPFMPFITEELWQRLIHGSEANDAQPKSISLTPYPHAGTTFTNGSDEQLSQFRLFQEVVSAAREVRADRKIEPKKTEQVHAIWHSLQPSEEDLSAIAIIAKLEWTKPLQRVPDVVQYARDFTLYFYLQPTALASADVSSARLEKENATLERNIENYKRQLEDPLFVSKAPVQVVANMRAKLAEYEAQIAKNREQLTTLAQ